MKSCILSKCHALGVNHGAGFEVTGNAYLRTSELLLLEIL